MMLDGPLITIEQFLDSRFELPESGQWAELEAGKVILFQPPDLDYGTTVLNLSKSLADYIQRSGPGYACFDLGLLLQTNPDTVRFPAACYFLTGSRFEETDKAFTTRIPELVIELASTSDRRSASEQRAADYLSWGAVAVWLIDPAARQVQSLTKSSKQIYSENDSLEQSALLPDYRCEVKSLFVEPGWWSAQ